MASLQGQPEEYDLVILGGGTGSTIAAWTFAGEGRRVAVIDRKYIGGSCPNIACLPSKNIIHSAKVASYFQRAREFGIIHDGFTVDMSGVRDRKRKMVTGLNEMYLENYRERELSSFSEREGSSLQEWWKSLSPTDLPVDCMVRT
jgi:pyruvate/2-oxoglutarate dehydrogenase complex dihydrolipoamide dehydrogenase (E3) component